MPNDQIEAEFVCNVAQELVMLVTSASIPHCTRLQSSDVE